jgi:hypothetical protein
MIAVNVSYYCRCDTWSLYVIYDSAATREASTTIMLTFYHWGFVFHFSSYCPKEEFSGHSRKANEVPQYSFYGDVILYNCHESN